MNRLQIQMISFRKAVNQPILNQVMSVEKILAIKLRELGDVVLWTSALKTLREKFPKARIDVLVLPASEPLLREVPFVNRILTIQSSRSWNIFKRMLSLRSEGYDLVLGFHVSTSLARFARLLNAKQMALHHHSWKYSPRPANLKIPRPGNLENALKRDYQLLEALGFESQPILPTQLVVTAAEQDWALQQLPPMVLPRVAVLPGAGAVIRQYPRDLWIETLDKLLRFKKVVPVVMADAALSAHWNLEKICQERGLALFDHLRLRQLMSLISQCQLALGNDSGPIHIAAALGLKTLTLFGPGCVGDWHPYALATHRKLQIEVPCRSQGPRDLPEFQFCTLPSCSHLSCLRGISPQQIFAELKDLMVR